MHKKKSKIRSTLQHKCLKNFFQLIVIIFFSSIFIDIALCDENTYHSLTIRDIANNRAVQADGFINDTNRWRYRDVMHPYVVVEGSAEAYVDFGNSGSRWQWQNQSDIMGGTIYVRTPKSFKGVIKGTLYIPGADDPGMKSISFSISKDSISPDSRKEFYNTKEKHYNTLLSKQIPGAAWFRHQVRESRFAQTGKKDGSTQNTNRNRRFNRASQLEQTCALFTGGRAMSENLQLDRILQTRSDSDVLLPIKDIKGITIREMDWTDLIKDKKPDSDKLADKIPAEQYALFFPTFEALVTMTDESAKNGTPVLRMLEPRSESAKTRERYEKQLCLTLNVLSRQFGPKFISEIALTGSDPYIRTGSDLSIMFYTKNPIPVHAMMMAKHQMALKQNKNARQINGHIQETIPYTSVITPDRAISSYVATIGKTVIVTNSVKQLEAIADVIKQGAKSIASLSEYTYFRSQYKKTDNDESAFLIISDAAIRRWCGPKWRIATSRRTRAAAIMAELKASHFDKLVKNISDDINEKKAEPEVLDHGFKGFDPGRIICSDKDIISSVYNTLSFLTPITELDIPHVTQAESRAYERWRDGYQRNWSRYFDPVAIRFSVKPDNIAMDMTVMPLIAGSEYREFEAIAKGAVIAPDAGDRHKESLLHIIMSINSESGMIKQAGTWLQPRDRMLPGTSPLSWLGPTISYYMDDDPIWDEIARAKRPERFMENNIAKIPLAFRLDSKSPLKLAMFMTGLRTYIEQTAPGLTTWESMTYKDQPYVRIRPNIGGIVGSQFYIYYATKPDHLLITVNEGILKRSLDRDKTETDDIKNDDIPWQGKNLCLKMKSRFIDTIDTLFGKEWQMQMQFRSWGNIPILNELKKMYPGKDPVKLYEDIWHVRLLCPGSGKYTWNEKWETFESTIYGHPGQQKTGNTKPAALLGLVQGNFGLTFLDDGLRAKVVLKRK